MLLIRWLVDRDDVFGRRCCRESSIGALARLQLGRAYAMEGDTGKAKAAYQDFFTFCKDADPDIPILRNAKAEHAKLHWCFAEIYLPIVSGNRRSGGQVAC